VGRTRRSTTLLLDDERAWWTNFHQALSRLDQACLDELWTHAFQIRAAFTAHNTPNVTEPLLMSGAAELQRRGDVLRADLRQRILAAEADWTGWQEVLPRDEQAAQRRLWSHAHSRVEAISAHGTRNLAEPILFSMLVGLSQDVQRLEHAVEALRVPARRPA
jgi:hypothetical protein